jgi:hypothetical protein
MADVSEPSQGDGDELEARQVKVQDPALSPETNARLTDQLRDVVGTDSVEVPKSRPHASRGEHVEPASRAVLKTSGSLMGAIAGFAALIVAGIAATAATGSWWFVAAALVIDVIGIIVIATMVIQMTAVTERPAATLAAAMEQEGVVNPEERFTEIVDEFRTASVDGDGHRDTAVEDDPVAAGAEQKSAMTPTGGTSSSVGP